jgi:hypothetical protein
MSETVHILDGLFLWHGGGGMFKQFYFLLMCHRKGNHVETVHAEQQGQRCGPVHYQFYALPFETDAVAQLQTRLSGIELKLLLVLDDRHESSHVGEQHMFFVGTHDEFTVTAVQSVKRLARLLAGDEPMDAH